MTADLDTRRARLRSDATLAARVVPTHYPLETFIAVNPLAGLESMPFEQAIRRAADLYGSRGTLGEAAFRALHAAGRITDDDLDQALRRRYPNLVAGPDLSLGGITLSPVELLRSDLLFGTGTPEAGRRFRTRAEDRSPAVAAASASSTRWLRGM